MYTRVKRERRKVKRDMYGMPIEGTEDKGTTSGEDETTTGTSDTSGICKVVLHVVPKVLYIIKISG